MRKDCQKTRKLRKTFIITQNENNWKTYLKFCDVKQKRIKKVKTMEFQKTINDNANDKKRIWRLIKWIKNKNRMSKKISKMSTLIREIEKRNEIEQTIDFKNKMKFFYDEFFLHLLQSILMTYRKRLIWQKLIAPS